MDAQSKHRYETVFGCESVKEGVVTEDFIRMTVTAYFNGMFEVVRHGPSGSMAAFVGPSGSG